MKGRISLLFFALLFLCALGCGGAETLPGASSPTPPTPVEPERTESALPGPEAIAPASTTACPTEALTTAPPEPTEEPSANTDVPEPEADPTQELVEAYLEAMSLEEKLAQLFVVTPEALTGVRGPVTVAREATREAYDRIPVGGLLYMGKNLENPEQTRALLAATQEISLERTGLPVFLCVDEEGGSVARISGNPAFGLEPIPDMAELGAGGDPEAAREIGRRMGSYLRDLGFNLDFAPCADVWTNPENRVVARRSFGSDPQTVIQMAGALAEGLLEAGVLPCYKHFPGHGGTAADSHKGFAALDMDLNSLKDSRELQPFLDAAERDMPLIMTGHIALTDPACGGLPASLSPALIGLLRDAGYQGLLITDALSMGAVTERFSPGEAAVLAIQAGNDLLLVSDSLKESYEALLAAVREGSLSEERIDESLRRILRCKLALAQ